MGQPVDFVGLNTFIYEVSGWFPPDQNPARNDFIASSKAETSTNNEINVPVHQNHRGCNITIDHDHLGFFKNHLFPLQLPDPDTGLAPVDEAGRLRVTASLFPALMLYRNGPYGWPIWKQIRIGQNPLTRKQKKHSIFTYVEEPGPTIEYTTNFGSNTVPQSYSDIRTFSETAVASKYKPMQAFVSQEQNFNLGNMIVIRSTLGNDMVYFDNKSPDTYFNTSKEESEHYTQVKSLYLDGKLQNPGNPIKSFGLFQYSETVYPKLSNVYRNYARLRENYDFPWNGDIRLRVAPGTSDTNDVFYKVSLFPTIDNGFSFSVYYQSRWVTDARWNFNSYLPASDGLYEEDGNSGNGSLSFDDYQRLQPTRKSLGSSSIFFPPIGGARKFGDNLSHPYSRRQDVVTNSAGGEGQLMNSYSMFADWRQVYNFDGYADNIDEFLSASCLYSRRHVIPSPKSIAHFAGIEIEQTSSYVDNTIMLPIEYNFGGSSKWQADTTRRIPQETFPLSPYILESKEPFYNSYSDFAEYTKILGKDYTLVPEFRISEHVEKYLQSPTIEEDDFGIFEVSGGLAGTSSSDVTEFYKIYSNSDFMKHFELVSRDHNGFVEPSTISLKCNIIKKFIPYEGFYPAQRSVQLAKQFYKSYGDHITSIRSTIEVANDPSEMIGSPQRIQLMVKGKALYHYYNQPGLIQDFLFAFFYGGEFISAGGDWFEDKPLRPICNLSDEGATARISSDVAMSCEAGSEVYNMPGLHPNNVWKNNTGYWYNHNPSIDKNNQPLSSRGFGFYIQDSHRRPLYIQLIDERVYDRMSSKYFYKGVKRDYMFPSADFDYVKPSDKTHQPLLINSSQLKFQWAGGIKEIPAWRNEWTAALESSQNKLPPFKMPVIWVRAGGDSAKAHITPSTDFSDMPRRTAKAIVDAINDLANDELGAVHTPQTGITSHGPTRILNNWYSREATFTFAETFGFSTTDSQPVLDPNFPSVPNTQTDWDCTAALINEPTNPDEESNYFIEITQRSPSDARTQDERIATNYCSAFSISNTDGVNETELIIDDALNSDGMWTVFDKSILAGQTVINSQNNSNYTKIQPLLTPLFAPGILYNTIKSGIACDYPLMTNGINRVLASVPDNTLTNQDNKASFWMIGSRTGATGSFVGDLDLNYFTATPTQHSVLGGDSEAYLSSSRFTTDKGTLGTLIDNRDSGSDGHPGHNSYLCLALKRNQNVNQFRGFDFRVPFEALIEPENYLSQRILVNQEPDNFLYFAEYMRMNYKTVWTGQGDMIYKKMAHNFLAEIPEFFLSDGNLKSFKSLKQGDPNFGLVEAIENGQGMGDSLTEELTPKEYTMRIKIFRSTTGEQGTYWSNGTRLTPPQDLLSEQDPIKESLTMYSRPSAFGPPSWDGYPDMKDGSDGIHCNDNRAGINYPFTPPYYHGEAWADITFVPSRVGKHSLDEIIASSSVEYYRYWNPKSNLSMIKREDNANSGFRWTSWTGSLNNQTSSIGTFEDFVHPDGSTYEYSVDGNWYGPQHPLFVNDNAMQLSSCLNIFGKEEKAPLLDAPLSNVDQNQTRWVIQTKFETPVLNFNHLSSSGEKQIIELDFHSFHGNLNRIRTAGNSLSITVPTFGTFDIIDPDDYNDNRIEVYDGRNKYNFYFNLSLTTGDSVRIFRNGNFYASQTLPAEYQVNSFVTISLVDRVPSIDPNEKGHAQTVRVDVDGLTTDAKIAEAFADAVNTKTNMSATYSNQKVYITGSFVGESLPPSYSTDLRIIAANHGLKSPKVLVSGSFDEGSVHLDHAAPPVTTVGMWHQYGTIPKLNEGVFMEIGDIPKEWKKGALGVHTLAQSLTGSLVDLVGFSRERKRIGQVADSKKVSEAVVAVPFIIENGERKFFEIPREDIDDAQKPLDTSERFAGSSVRRMVKKMKKYVFPLQFDFLNRQSITPFAMYIFEFHHTFNKVDLADMWQGLPPNIGVSHDKDMVSISHELLSSELMGGGSSKDQAPVPISRNKDTGLPVNHRLRWMVFKVKQKAKTNYYEKVVKKPSLADLVESNSESLKSFNWPYDYFSFIELVKLDATFGFTKVEEIDDEGNTQIGAQTSSLPPFSEGTRVISPNIGSQLASRPTREGVASRMRNIRSMVENTGSNEGV